MPKRFDESVMKAYWAALPRPIEQDMEDEDAAARHIRAILKALSESQPSEDSAPPTS